MPFLPFSRRSGVIRRGGIAAGIAMIAVISVGLAMPSTSAAPARPAGASQVSPSTLVSEWLAALGPASENFPKIETALKALPITATTAQVESIVAPVAGLVKPIEALVPSKLSPPSHATSLEALGTPTLAMGGGSDLVYRSASAGATLVIGGKTYNHGFQVKTDWDGDKDTLTWPIGGAFQTFTAKVGLNTNNLQSAELAFLQPTGKPLTFTADGRSVTQITLISGVAPNIPGIPTNIKMTIRGDQYLIMEIIDRNGSSAVVDVADDTLTSS